ncbi:MAG: ABC transporter permease [Anaerolineae bacterium]|jgi:fluoroquinolone transport system permease protein|nr:ABC transporter permease [Anaerolineae bacterium]MBT4311299.1 ABC transporter permease [Anaerolineae bacterium]MBT4457003.1 ABC transporter permease [Anaerolineae bacterium]MBT4841511.1 ABC transporter permease [Anaerolineae bacterium]MBT6061374.1 ABC transporter permease [Anaerolineae bacterium]
MTRLISTMRWDMRLQWRNGFYYAAIAIVVMYLLIFSQIPKDNLTWLLPLMLIGNMIIGTFYFIGGLVLLERGEGSLEARVITPLRPIEYIISKVATLSGLALLESGLIIIISYGLDVNWLALLAGVVEIAVFFCLVGFIIVVRYDSINEYLLPSILYTMLICLPLVSYLAGWEHWLLYLHPTQATLMLLKGAWQPLLWWKTAYALIYPGLWIAWLIRLSLRAFHRFVITK